jgi:diaminopimelate decarboxylase
MIDLDAAQKLIAEHDSPLYVYDKAWLEDRAQQLLEANKPANCTIRFAVKANPHPEIIRLFAKTGMEFDASSEFEATNLIDLGISAEKISLSSQQPPKDMRTVLESGVRFVATSLHQLDMVGRSGWQGELGVRINPGMGSGHNNRTTTGGVSASFGIWHEYIPNVLEWQKSSGCTISRLHVHVGSGANSEVWRSVMQNALSIVAQMPSVQTLDIGGGYKVARVEDEKETDMGQVMDVFRDELRQFEQKTGRKLALEIEPGTWLVANSGVLLSTIVDIVDTGADGFTFLKLDTGMNDLLRPALYGAQHPITVLNVAEETLDYVVVGHNCESGDILTPAPGDPESILPRKLNKASIGDIVMIGGVGAYAASMRAIGYNAFPEAQEVLV